MRMVVVMIVHVIVHMAVIGWCRVNVGGESAGKRHFAFGLRDVRVGVTDIVGVADVVGVTAGSVVMMTEAQSAG